MGVCCKRVIAFLVFLLFGTICGIIAVIVSGEIQDKSPNEFTGALYGFLLITAIRYNQFMNECKRCISASIIGTAYIVYWILMILLFLEYNEWKIFLMIISSMGTALCDAWVFSNRAYSDEYGTYTVLPEPV